MESLQDRLIRHEGLKTLPYLDTTGNWTIGVGHKITENQAKTTFANGISTQDALGILDVDIASIKQQCAQAFPWILGLNDVRQSVIWEMAFQLGVAGVSAFHKMIAALRDGDYATASSEMLNSQWHRETPARCEEVAELMLNGYTNSET